MVVNGQDEGCWVTSVVEDGDVIVEPVSGGKGRQRTWCGECKVDKLVDLNDELQFAEDRGLRAVLDAGLKREWAAVHARSGGARDHVQTHVNNGVGGQPGRGRVHH